MYRLRCACCCWRGSWTLLLTSRWGHLWDSAIQVLKAVAVKPQRTKREDQGPLSFSRIHQQVVLGVGYILSGASMATEVLHFTLFFFSHHPHMCNTYSCRHPRIDFRLRFTLRLLQRPADGSQITRTTWIGSPVRGFFLSFLFFTIYHLLARGLVASRNRVNTCLCVCSDWRWILVKIRRVLREIQGR